MVGGGMFVCDGDEGDNQTRWPQKRETGYGEGKKAPLKRRVKKVPFELFTWQTTSGTQGTIEQRGSTTPDNADWKKRGTGVMNTHVPLQASSAHLPTSPQKKHNSHLSDAEQNMTFQGRPDLNSPCQSNNICLVTVIYKKRQKEYCCYWPVGNPAVRKNITTNPHKSSSQTSQHTVLSPQHRKRYSSTAHETSGRLNIGELTCY